jgi:hypothetical protein
MTKLKMHQSQRTEITFSLRGGKITLIELNATTVETIIPRLRPH